MIRRHNLLSQYGGIDDYTLLCVHGTSLTDSSKYNRTLTSTGSLSVNNSTKHFSKYGSLYFPGSNGTSFYCSNLISGYANFTIDFWFAIINYNYTHNFYSHNGSNSGMVMSCDMKAYDRNHGISFYRNAWAIPTYIYPDKNTWHHLALSGNSSTFYFFVDGVLKGTYSRWYCTNSVERFGYNDDSLSETVYGYMQEIRVSSNVRWTSNFTPPTKPYSKGKRIGENH